MSAKRQVSERLLQEYKCYNLKSSTVVTKELIQPWVWYNAYQASTPKVAKKILKMMKEF